MLRHLVKQVIPLVRRFTTCADRWMHISLESWEFPIRNTSSSRNLVSISFLNLPFSYNSLDAGRVLDPVLPCKQWLPKSLSVFLAQLIFVTNNVYPLNYIQAGEQCPPGNAKDIPLYIRRFLINYWDCVLIQNIKYTIPIQIHQPNTEYDFSNDKYTLQNTK